jgi:hypothetical protein
LNAIHDSWYYGKRYFMPIQRYFEQGESKLRPSGDLAFVARLEQISAKFPSRAALAKAANIPPSSLQAYFEGAEPTRPVLVALAHAARVSIEWLAEGRGYREPHPCPTTT